MWLGELPKLNSCFFPLLGVAGGDMPLRKVTVVGSPEAQWKAQYLIYEKLREEGFTAGMEDVRLTVEILVPSAQVKVDSSNMSFLPACPVKLGFIRRRESRSIQSCLWMKIYILLLHKNQYVVY